MSDVDLRISALNVHPIKSCAGVAVDQALLIDTGLEFDREWMVVDNQGVFVTQRELPRMALVQPQVKSHEIVLRAPGMLALHLAVDAVEEPCRVKVWKDEVAAYDMGRLASQWFSDFLGRALRLVRFDPAQRRLSNRQWTGEIEAANAFSDGFPVLVASQASLDEVNRRLTQAGRPAVTMQRFRPNIVIDGVQAHDEDNIDEMRFESSDGPIVLKLVKPCSRCTIPDVDLHTAQQGHAVADVLQSYRSDARLGGAVTFAMNAVIVDGVDRIVRTGMTGGASYRFD